jgi:membrane fusion protein YbhG
MSRCLPLALAAVSLASSLACQRTDAGGSITASGHVEATDVRLTAKVPGRIAWFPVQEGTAVAAEQELLRIDTTDIDLALALAEADHAAADAELRLRVAGARPEDIAETAAQARSIAADLEGAERDLGRMQSLLEKGSGTTQSRDAARTRRDVLAARREAARQALQRLEAGSRRQEIEAARARAASASARIDQLRQQKADARLVSPLAGVLTERLVEPGELVQAGTPLAVVTNLAEAWLSVYVPETDLARIRLGQAAEARTDDGQTRTGRITFIASKAEFTPKNVQTRDERVKLVFKVKVGLDNADGLFKPGMPAEARFEPAATVAR